MPKLLSLAAATLVGAFTVPAHAQLNALGSPEYVYQLGEIHTDPTDRRPYAPLSYISPGGEVWGDSIAQTGGDLRTIVESGNDVRGFIVFQSVLVTNGGHTFVAQANAPWRSPNGARGGYAEVYVNQTYIKETEDATLRYTYNFGEMYLANYGGRPAPLGARVDMSVELFEFRNGSLFFPEWMDAQSAVFSLDRGSVSDPQDDRWKIATSRDPLSDATYPAWDWSCTCANNDGNGESLAYLTNQRYTQFVDLSGVDVNGEFGVSFLVRASAWDFVQGETVASASLQDPISIGGAYGFEFEGLRPTDRGFLVRAPVPEPAGYVLIAVGLAFLAVATRRARPAQKHSDRFSRSRR